MTRWKFLFWNWVSVKIAIDAQNAFCLWYFQLCSWVYTWFAFFKHANEHPTKFKETHFAKFAKSAWNLWDHGIRLLLRRVLYDVCLTLYYKLFIVCKICKWVLSPWNGIIGFSINTDYQMHLRKWNPHLLRLIVYRLVYESNCAVFLWLFV